MQVQKICIELILLGGAGNPSNRSGMAIHVYAANSDMKTKAFYNSDGDFLIGRF